MIEFDVFWYVSESDGSICACCKSPIVDKMYSIVTQADDTFIEAKSKLCEKCYFEKVVVT